MRIFIELTLFVLFILALPALPLAIGHILHARRHPQDLRMVKVFLERARENPDSFKVTCDSSIEAKDDIFKAASYGSLSAERQSLTTSTWSEMRVNRAVKRLWKHHGRTDPNKTVTLEKLAHDA